MRNDIYERMKHFVIEDIKPNYAAIARQFEVDPRTVKAAYRRALTGQSNETKRVVKRKSKLDGYRDIIQSKYSKGCTARAIYDFIQDKGFEGKYTIVKDYCRKFKSQEIKKATIRVEHTIGLSAQVDWKERITLHDKKGTPHVFSIFLYVMPYSKQKYLKLTLDQKQDTLFRCLYEAFQADQGIPKEI